VNFVRKELYVSILKDEISLRQLVELLAGIGYEPHISLEDYQKSGKRGDRINKRLIYQLGITINKNISLLSSGGRAVTTINGSSAGAALGTVFITNNTTGVVIGATGQGFTINGYDGPSPGIEEAAVYFQGPHSGATIQDNEIVANGDGGLITEFSATIDNFTIDRNTFSGQTFVAPGPADCGFSGQFTTPNVPRQLVTMGGGSSGGNTTNITFTNNQITGTAGGPSTVGICATFGQGNTLVTIDANGATITGNTFDGTTSGFGGSLPARGSMTVISGNTFESDNLGTGNSHIFLDSDGSSLGGATPTVASVATNNTFSPDKGVYITTPQAGASPNQFVMFTTLQQGIFAATSGQTLKVLPGTYPEAGQIVINKNLTIEGSGKNNTIIQPTANTGTTGDPRGWWLVNPGVVLNLERMTLDGNGFLVWQGIRQRGSGTIDSVRFTEIKYNPSTNYQGTAVAAFGDGNVDITNSMFDEIGRIGVLYFGTGITGSNFTDNEVIKTFFNSKKKLRYL
jgi:hypothetical protein